MPRIYQMSSTGEVVKRARWVGRDIPQGFVSLKLAQLDDQGAVRSTRFVLMEEERYREDRRFFKKTYKPKA